MSRLAPLAAAVSLALMPAALRADSRSYDVGPFTSVSVHDGIAATVTVGPEVSVTGTALRGDLDRLKVEVRGDTLRLTRQASWGLFGTGRRDRFEVVVTLPDLEELTSTAGASVDLDGASGDLVLSSTSGASLRAEGIEAGKIEASASSGASMRLSGTCDSIEAEASSGASLLAEDLACAKVVGESTSGSSLSLRASETADLSASSGASIRIAGDPEEVTREVSSGASIRSR